MSLSVYTLFSGSSANATLIRSDRSAILIDAGGSMKKIVTALAAVGCPIGRIDAIFITHEHSDHIAALPMLAKHHRIPIHITVGSAPALRAKVDPALCIVHPMLYEETVGDLQIRSFATSHDSRMSVGYTVTSLSLGTRIGIATDTGVVTEGMIDALTGVDASVIEANHDPAMLRSGPYPADLKARIVGRGGHLSNLQSAELIERLAAGGTRRFLLAHLSLENNRPELALRTVVDRLKSAGLDASVAVASRTEVTPLIEDRSSRSADAVS